MKRSAFFITALFAVLTLCMVVPLDAVAQCPMCKAAVESNTNYGEGESWLASMLNTGIFYLFALPYLTIMGVGFFWYRGYKRRQREEAKDAMVTLESVLGDQTGTGDGPPA